MENKLSDLLNMLYGFYFQEIDLNLNRLIYLLDKLGNPHKSLPPILHVAGTNGKGSTVAFCRSILEAEGCKVHAYTSPHLIQFNERIRLNGKLIDDELLYQTLKDIVQINDSNPITFFEATTAAAFVLFSKIPADVLLLETGLGGRLDATNVIESPLVSIITPISLDHQEFLGNTLSKIAFEKSGIIKPNCPVVISKQSPEVIEVLKKEAILKESPYYVYGNDWDLDILAPYPPPNLKGDHQRMNAATALKALSVCFNLKPESIHKGLPSAEWPGRLQCIQEGAHEIWIDGAHNPGGAETLTQELKKWSSGKPIIGILGMKERKDARQFIKILAPYLNKVIFIPLRENDKTGKSYSPDDLLVISKEENLKASKANNHQDALAQIQNKYPQSLTIITGSLFLMGEVLYPKCFKSRAGV
ncbi:MAG: bifunctional folylpolyglutamate synthase/dihydrofolate synthase [Alphaproteobacteria bacterium]|nr:bifunctional folylpolyglutamate synthase/dihydrofolate synthase [Alphaproteobacteria bacterium]